MAERNRVDVEHLPEMCIVRIVGEVDISNADQIARALDECDGNETRQVVDLTETTYIDSAGLRLLFSLAERLRSRRRQLHVIVGHSGSIRRVLELTDLAKRATIHARIEEVTA